MQVVAYRESDGTIPLVDWLRGLPVKPRLKCLAKIERLRLLSYELRRPEADSLRDGIYELRTGLQGVNYRLLYFYYRNVAVVVSHGLTKADVVPATEINLAIRRRQAYVADPGRHTAEL